MKNKTSGRLDLARRIRAAGRPIYIAEDDGEISSIPFDGLIVRQVGGVVESCVFEWSGGTGFMIELAITVNIPTLAISYFGIELPWQQMYFRWLEDPLESDGTSTFYRFGGKPILEFERSRVLNHRADVRRTLSSGQSITGLLLGQDMAPIPNDLRIGTKFPATIIIGDQFEREYRAPVELFVNRRERNSAPRPAVRKRAGLFERPDHAPLPDVSAVAPSPQTASSVDVTARSGRDAVPTQ